MPLKTKHYHLEYLKGGSLYSAASDQRRFTTLDYNLQSYVGIVGVGVIGGWEIKTNTDDSFAALGDLQIAISYGTGLVNGYFAESPYYVKRRTHMDIPDREIEVVRFDATPEPYMTSQERLDYESVIQDYDPSFVAPNPCENTYVKTVLYNDADPTRTATITLVDGTDSYVYAEFPPNWVPYPKLTDSVYASFDLNNLNPPKSSDFPNDYSGYLAALSEYQEKLEAYHAYNWKLYPENHYTEVQFKTYSSRQNSSSKVLLGIVTTRSGKVQTINTSSVDSLANLNATIKKKATSYLVNHIHGGPKEYDPEKINLETDIRECILNTYYPENGSALFDIEEKYYTSLVDGHKHSYVIDKNGNGQTIEHFGDGVKHFHQITSFVVSQPLTSYAAVDAHTHTITNTASSVDGWTTSSSYNVYANKKLIGTQASTNISLDLSKKQVKIFGGFGIQYKTYYCEFQAYGSKYSFTKSAFSMYSFMLSLMADYYSKLRVSIDTNPSDSPITATVVKNPSASKSLISQSEAADKSLINAGDSFVFTTPVAQNISVSSIRVPTISSQYKVTIEVLGNSEVTGIIREENVVFIHADKFISGQFDIARIPFISHIGRLNEAFSPYRLPMGSRNGYKYQALPYVTSITDGHYHTVFVDLSKNGQSVDTMIGEDAVYYATGGDGKEYDIEHSHNISHGFVAASSSSGYDSWKASFQTEAVTTSAGTTNVTAGTHLHGLQQVAIGDGKSIYSVAEDSNGNMWIGSSNGLLMKPTTAAYKFTIDGQNITRIGDDLWALVLEAAVLYQQRYNKSLVISSEYEQTVYDIQEELTSHNDSKVFSVKSDGSSVTTNILITKLDYITFSDLYTSQLKQAYEIEGDDIIVGIRVFKIDSGQEISLNDENLPVYMYDDLIKVYYETQKNISFDPYWNIFVSKRLTSDSDSICEDATGNDVTTEDVNILSAKTFAYSYLVEEDLEKEWATMRFQSGTEVLKKAFRDKYGNLWVSSNNSLAVSRKHMGNGVTERLSNPSTSQVVNDILEDGQGDILLATDIGIYRSADQGKTWTLDIRSEIGFVSIVRDYSRDITDGEIGHRHSLSVNAYGDGTTSVSTLGNSHTHTVNGWVIQDSDGHSHSIETTLYGLESDGTIYRKYRNGAWEKLTTANFSQRGKIFAFMGNVLLSTDNGLYLYNGNDWAVVDSEIPYSFNMSFDMTKMMVGYYNKVKTSADGQAFEIVFSLDGSGQAFIEKDGDKSYFGYSVSNRLSSYYFDTVTIPESQLAIASFDRWLSTNGGWGNSNVDIYFDGKLKYSKEKGVDERGISVPYFKIDSDNGLLDFSATAATSGDTLAYSSKIAVDNSDGFFVGDKILVYNNTATKQTTPPTDITLVSDSVVTNGEEVPLSYNEIIEKYAEKVKVMQELNSKLAEESTATKMLYEQYKVFDVVSVESGWIGISPISDSLLESGCLVMRLSPFGIDNKIVANINQSTLYDSGTVTHEKLEDNLSSAISGLPYKLSNAYCSNILQLSQAIRYVYPDVTQYFRNSKFYDMHYSDDELSENPPYIGNYIDIYNSLIHTKAIYDSEFSPKKASKINCIFVGTDSFSGIIFAGTDIGLMWSNLSSSGEENWVYVPNLNFQVYSVRVHLGNSIMVGTENGAYVSSDLKEWTRITEGVISFPCHDIKLRWNDKQALYINATSVSFQNITGEDGVTRGLMTVADDVSGMLPNRVVTLSDTGNVFIGSYVIDSVGVGVIYIREPFTDIPPDGVYNLAMALWWGQFDNETNINTNLNNPIIAAGYNGLSVALYPYDMVWQAASIEGVNTEYIADDITPLSSGSAVASLTTVEENEKAMIIKSTDSGANWKPIKTFQSYLAKIVSFSPTKDGHTKLKVQYTNAASVPNGVQRLQSATIIGSSKLYSILWNENDGTDSYIYVYGTSIVDFIGENDVIRVSTVNINCIEEFGSSMFIGTDVGIWGDNGSVYGKNSIKGRITATGVSGTVTSFDVNGIVLSVSVNENGLTTMSIGQLDAELYNNQLENGTLYVRNVSPVEKMTILSNTSTRASGETFVETNRAYTSSMQNYVGRKITMSGAKTKVYVSVNGSMAAGELDGGTIFITSKNPNISQMFEIETNGEDYVELKSKIDFSSKSNKAIEGNSVLMINSKGELILYVNLDKEVDDMALIGMEISLLGTIYAKFIDGNITIKSNEANKIVLNKIGFSDHTSVESSKSLEEKLLPFLFNANDEFLVSGNMIQPVKQFEFYKTSEEEGHYHGLSMVGEKLQGIIGSISQNANTKYVDVTVDNLSGFDNAILSIDPYLMDGEQAIFTNTQNPYIYFKRTVKSITGSVIMVEKGKDEWDMAENNQDLISNGWKMTIDARTYGFTSGTFYNDFQVLSKNITQDIPSGGNIVHVESTTGFSSGNKVKIVSVSNKSEENFVSSVIDSTRLELRFGLSKSYQVGDGAYIGLLSNSYPNTHTHKITKNRIESINVSEYHDIGYKLNHSHETQPYIANVSDIVALNDELAVCGDSSKVYFSQDGSSWYGNVDINNATEGGKDVNVLHSMATDASNNLIVGADDMHLYFRNFSRIAIEDLENPVFE